MTRFIRSSAIQFALLLILAGVSASYVRALTCPGAQTNTCYLHASNPCVGCSTCCPIANLNLQSGATSIVCTNGSGINAYCYKTQGSLVTDWFSCSSNSGAGGKTCTYSAQTCQTIILYMQNFYEPCECDAAMECGTINNTACQAGRDPC